MNHEVWRPTRDSRYEISDQGNIRSLDRVVETVTTHSKYKTKTHTRTYKGKVLKVPTNRYGYKQLMVPNKFAGEHSTIRIHRIVAEAFLERPEGCDFVDHINGDKTDNRAENLRWVSKKTNNRNTPYTRYLQDLLEKNGIPFTDVDEWDPKGQ